MIIGTLVVLLPSELEVKANEICDLHQWEERKVVGLGENQEITGYYFICRKCNFSPRD